jgi:chemotaxis protein MotB
VRQVVANAQKSDPRSAVAELSPYQALLKKSLKEEIEQGEVEIHMEKRGLVISFKQAALFDSGRAIITPLGIPTMQKVGAVISKIPNQVRLEGHTDNIPIHNDLFRNNWELSSARSIAILSLLSDKFSVAAKRLSVSGYADVAPIASNDTEVGRSKNRRVDVVVVSSAASWSEPGKDPSLAPEVAKIR